MPRPLPFAEPDRLIRIWESEVERGRPTFAVSHPNFVDFRGQATSVQSMGATQNTGFTLTPANRDADLGFIGECGSMDFNHSIADRRLIRNPLDPKSEIISVSVSRSPYAAAA